MLDITVYHGRELVSFLSSLEKQLIQRLPELTDRPASRAGSLLRRWSGKWVSVLVCILQMKHHTRERRAVQNDVTNDSTPTYLAFPVEHVKAIRLYASKPFLELHTGRSVNLPHKFLYGRIMLFYGF